MEREHRGGQSATPLVSIEVYTREPCPLCDEAKETLAGLLEGVPHDLVVHDIDRDPLAFARFRHEVPVVYVDGVKRFVGHVPPVLFRRLLDQSRARRARG